MTQITSRRSKITLDSGQNSTVPTLAKMIRDARSDHVVIRRASQEALKAWFRQSERLNVARRHYRLHGARFLDFARRLGITDHTSAYALVHLPQYRAKITAKCIDDAATAAKRGQVFHYPGWETALGWFHKPARAQETGRFWLTPPALYRKLDAESTLPTIRVPTRYQRATMH